MLHPGQHVKFQIYVVGILPTSFTEPQSTSYNEIVQFGISVGLPRKPILFRGLDQYP